MTEISTESPKKKKKDLERIIIRPWPKVIFLYPTLIMAMIGCFASVITQKPGDPGSATIGWLFCLVFFLNLLVFAFDFSRVQSITIIFVIIAVVFGLAWAHSKWEVLIHIGLTLENVEIRMNTQFYGFVTTFMCFMFFLVFINTRFNYYEINRNEILHHHGYLGDIHRTPTTAMRMQKEIYDLMEYALLRSGRLIFYPSTAREAIVIDNVIRINQVETSIKHLLSSVSVALRPDEEDGVAM